MYDFICRMRKFHSNIGGVLDSIEHWLYVSSIPFGIYTNMVNALDELKPTNDTDKAILSDLRILLSILRKGDSNG